MTLSKRSQLIKCLLCLVWLGISLSQGLQAAVVYPGYDSIAITPKTWEEVDLTYDERINGHRYPGSIELLRPIHWLAQHQMNKVGNRVKLSIPEFGIHRLAAIVTAIKPTRLDTRAMDGSTQASRPVIGKFMRYAPIVKSYHFNDLVTGQVSVIHATPNHPFYVKNRKAFVPINKVSTNDDLVNQQGHTLRLICPANKTVHCGQRYNPQPMPVYNLEVYQQHHYFVGNDEVLVHNVYTCLECGKEFTWRSELDRHLLSHSGKKPFVCTAPGCGKAFSQRSNLTKHQLTHTGEKPFVCKVPGCGKAFTDRSNLNKHMRFHTGKKRFVCPVPGCGKAFAQGNDLKRHLRSSVHRNLFSYGKNGNASPSTPNTSLPPISSFLNSDN